MSIDMNFPNMNFPFPEKPWPNETKGGLSLWLDGVEHVSVLEVTGANDWYVRCSCGFWNGSFQRQTDAQMAWNDHLADG